MTDIKDDQPYVGNFANDVFSALFVYSYMPEKDPYVMYYKSCIGSPDYAWMAIGASNIFMTNLEQNSIGNDALSALDVSLGAATIIYINDDWEGGYMLFTGQTVSCLTQWSGWNDQTSSARQYNLANGAAFSSVVAQWSLLGSGGNIAQTVTIGYTTQETTTTTNTLETQISVAVEAGFEFEGISGSTTVTTSVANTVSTSVSNSITTSYTSSWQETCSGTGCPSGEVSLYSFGMTMSRPWESVSGFDYTLQLASSITQCVCSTYGPPLCPPNYCNDPTPNSCRICTPYS